MKRIVLLLTLLLPIITTAQLGKYNLITTHSVTPASGIIPGDVVQITITVQHPNWAACDSWMNGIILNLGIGYNPSSVNYISSPSPTWVSADLANDMPANSIGWGYDTWGNGTPFSSWGQSGLGPFTFVLNTTVVSISSNDLDINAFYYGDYDTGAYSFGSCGSINNPDGPYLFLPISALPVKLLSFDGKANKKHNALAWITQSEINNDYFLLEKSEDGINFSLLEIIQGSGNSNQQISYSAIDIHPYQTTYYKLTQVDFNGISESFDIIPVNNKSIESNGNPILTFNTLGQIVDDNYHGIVIHLYADDTKIKIIQRKK
jgi:hypothetical protein